MAKVSRDARTDHLDPKLIARLRADELQVIQDLAQYGDSSGWLNPLDVLGKLDKDKRRMSEADHDEQRNQQRAFLLAVAGQVGHLAQGRPWFRIAVEKALKGSKRGRARESISVKLNLLADHAELVQAGLSAGEADAVLAQRNDRAAETIANKRSGKGSIKVLRRGQSTK